MFPIEYMIMSLSFILIIIFILKTTKNKYKSYLKVDIYGNLLFYNNDIIIATIHSNGKIEYYKNPSKLTKIKIKKISKNYNKYYNLINNSTKNINIK